VTGERAAAAVLYLAFEVARSRGRAMDDVSDRLLAALSAFEAVAGEVTVDEAAARFDEAALQVFWRDWPRVGAWAGALWRQLDADLAVPSAPVHDTEVDEVGGEG
jgi:hypothetical protein